MKPIYIKFSNREVVDTREGVPGLLVDYDACADLVGIEILDPPSVPELIEPRTASKPPKMGGRDRTFDFPRLHKLMRAGLPTVEQADDALRTIKYHVDRYPIMKSITTVADTGVPFK